MNNRQYLFAQFGKQREKRLSLSMILEPSELPGDGWNLRTERSWRIGKDNQRDAASLRARKSGAFAAIRIFEQQDSNRWVILKVIPMVSTEDALLVLPETNLNFMAARKSHGVIDAEKSIEIELDFGLSNAKATEVTASDPNEVAKYRFVLGTVDRVIAAICCSGLGEGWTWPEIQEISSAQVRKIRIADSNL